MSAKKLLSYSLLFVVIACGNSMNNTNENLENEETQLGHGIILGSR